MGETTLVGGLNSAVRIQHERGANSISGQDERNHAGQHNHLEEAPRGEENFLIRGQRFPNRLTIFFG